VAEPSRREEYAQATRAAIVAAAVSCFAAEGYARTSIDAVAEAARVTKGGVYHHFQDKAALFEAAVVVMEDRLLAAIQARVEGLDGWELVAAGIDTYLEACGEEDFRRIALEDAPSALGWERWKALDEQYFLGTATALLVGLRDAGLIAVEDPGLAARLLLGALAEAGLAVATASDRPRARAAAAALVTSFLRSLEVPALGDDGVRT